MLPVIIGGGILAAKAALAAVAHIATAVTVKTGAAAVGHAAAAQAAHMGATVATQQAMASLATGATIAVEGAAFAGGIKAAAHVAAGVMINNAVSERKSVELAQEKANDLLGKSIGEVSEECDKLLSYILAAGEGVFQIYGNRLAGAEVDHPELANSIRVKLEKVPLPRVFAVASPKAESLSEILDKPMSKPERQYLLYLTHKNTNLQGSVNRLEVLLFRIYASIIKSSIEHVSNAIEFRRDVLESCREAEASLADLMDAIRADRQEVKSLVDTYKDIFDPAAIAAYKIISKRELWDDLTNDEQLTMLEFKIIHDEMRLKLSPLSEVFSPGVEQI